MVEGTAFTTVIRMPGGGLVRIATFVNKYVLIFNNGANRELIDAGKGRSLQDVNTFRSIPFAVRL